jgi:hypothetical protein
MSEQNQAVVRRIIEDYWNEKNPALATELFAANCSLHTPDGDLHGMKGVAQLLDVMQARSRISELRLRIWLPRATGWRSGKALQARTKVHWGRSLHPATASRCPYS